MTLTHGYWVQLTCYCFGTIMTQIRSFSQKLHPLQLHNCIFSPLFLNQDSFCHDKNKVTVYFCILKVQLEQKPDKKWCKLKIYYMVFFVKLKNSKQYEQNAYFKRNQPTWHSLSLMKICASLSNSGCLNNHQVYSCSVDTVAIKSESVWTPLGDPRGPNPEHTREKAGEVLLSPSG